MDTERLNDIKEKLLLQTHVPRFGRSQTDSVISHRKIRFRIMLSLVDTVAVFFSEFE